MDLSSAIQEFQTLMNKLSTDTSFSFLHWLKETINQHVLETEETRPGQTEQDKILESIRGDIRNSLPLNAIAHTEHIIFPTVGSNADCEPGCTVHVDAFLYEDDLVDELCEKGDMCRNYCTACGSRNVKPLTFITHSASVSQIKYIFGHLVPELSGVTVVDVGSRLGAVLYGAHLYSGASRIFGIEMNEAFCQLQQTVTEKYGFQDRIKVIYDDVLNQGEIMRTADVVILNNVFDFFVPVDVQVKIWSFLHQVLRRTGTKIITTPSIEESLESLQVKIDVSLWLRPIHLSEQMTAANQTLYGTAASEDSDLASLFMYEVL